MGNPEAKESLPVSNPLADALQDNAEQKPKLDYAKKITGYPNECPEITDTASDQYKKILQVLMPKLKDSIKKPSPRAPRHSDVIGGVVDGHVCYLLIDENATPKERVFRTGEEKPRSGQGEEATEIPPEKVEQKTKGYPEITDKNPPADVVKRALDTYKSQRGRDMQHEEVATAFDAKDYEYVVLRDDFHKPKPYRIFKSKDPVPE